MDDNTRDLLVRGIASAKAGELYEARFYLEWLLRLDPPTTQQNEATYWLSQISTDPVEKRQLLENILASDASDARARRQLAILNGDIKTGELVDPDHMHIPAPTGPQKTDAQRFICPQCGGKMTFTPDGQSLTCEYCASRQVMNAAPGKVDPVQEKDFIVAMATAKGHSAPVTMNAFTCQGCGTNFILPPEQLTAQCPYCGSVYALKQPETRQLVSPDSMIPFQVDEKNARASLKNWFDENDFKSLPKVAPGRGFYLPVWTFDIGGTISWNCQAHNGDRWLPDSGERTVMRTNIPILGTSRLPQPLQPAINTYNLSCLVPFDLRFLANWPAETYQINVGDASLEARQKVMELERPAIQDGYLQPMRDLSLVTSKMLVEGYNLVLLPAWITHYTLDEHRYEVLINGQTGFIYAQKPASGIGKLFHHLFNDKE